MAAGRFRLVLTSLVCGALVLPATAAVAEVDAASTAQQEAGAAAAAAFHGAAASGVEAEVGEAIADRILVTFRPGTAPDEAGRILATAGLDVEVVPGFDVQVVEVEPAAAAAVAAVLEATPGVERAEPDRKVAFRTSADPRRDEQWWWRNVSQQVRTASGEVRRGRSDIDIGAAPAWRAGRGAGVVVAVVDTGLDIHHPELRPNLWRNPREGRFPGCSNDRHGCNFSGQGPSGQVYDNAVDDAHGTHVAGVVAAAEDGSGTVGVAPQVQVMSVKFLVRREGRISDGVRAVQYAVEMGADVINASWGVVGRVTESDLERCQSRLALTDCSLAALERTIRDARIPVVAATGNDGYHDPDGRGCLRSEPNYPASSEARNVIAVTAVDSRGEVPCFANVSTSLVDVAAPGLAILSTTPEGTYGELDGTSQSAPMVTGVVALAIGRTGVRDGARLAAAVRAGARPFGHLGDDVRPSGLTRAGLASAPGTLQALGVDLGPCRTGAARAPFHDLDRRDVHTRNVDCIVQHGLAGGFRDGTFRPGQTVTRGQVATFLAGLVRTSRDLPVPARGRFSDLDGNVHRDSIEALAAIGVVDGYRDGTYKAGSRVSREQFASLLVRTYEELTSGRVRAASGGFSDVGGVHERNVNVGVHLGFIQGRNDGRFGPGDGVTRAQLGSLLRRALDKLVNDRVSTIG